MWLELSDGEIEAIHDALIDQEVELAQDDDSGQTKLAWVTDLAVDGGMLRARGPEWSNVALLLTSARGSYPGWSGAELWNQVSPGSLLRLLEAHCERCPSIKVMVQFADCAVVVRLRVP